VELSEKSREVDSILDEREALDAGAETQLEHSSGLGLWTASWGGTVATATFPLRSTGGHRDRDGCN
jgi:hypothetical protein